MYLPIKLFFEELGYTVKAEVKDADVSAIKDGELVIIEMKMIFSLKLLFQATQRQKITDNVYVAIPKPTFKVYKSKSFKEKLYLLKRLHLGLLLVGDTVKVELDPKPFNLKISQARSKKKKNLHLKEFSNRHGSLNTGGVTGTKIMTHYREQALLMTGLMTNGDTRIKDLKINVPKAASILQKNFYGWFERSSRGIYQLTESGSSAYLSNELFITSMMNNTKEKSS